MRRFLVSQTASVLACVFTLLLAATSLAADPPTTPPQDPAVLPIGLIVERQGGSLMRAELSVHSGTSSLAADSEARADWAPGSAGAVSFFSVSEPKPRILKKHDLVTIIEHEDASFSSNNNLNQQKSTDFNSELDSFIALRPSHLQLHSIISGGSNVPAITAKASRDYKGSGEVDREDILTDRVTAEVVDVRPNGTLVLQATKHIKTDEEEARMILTGVCRAADITADNSVLSTQMFDLDLTMSHSGAATDGASRGFVPRLLDMFSPF